jgi:hypothetical protein
LGQNFEHSFPHLFAAVAARAKGRTGFYALSNRRWVSDLKGALTVNVLLEYLQLWDLLEDVVLQHEIEGTHIWQFSTTGQYPAKTAYEAFFFGTTFFSLCERIWKNWAPSKCKFFMWTVAHKKCWTADHLAKKGLPTLLYVHSVTKLRRRLTTCWFPVFFPGKSGSLS